MPRCGTGLTDLAELGHKGKDALILSGLIVEGLAAGKKGVGIAQRIRAKIRLRAHGLCRRPVSWSSLRLRQKAIWRSDEWFGHRRKAARELRFWRIESTFASRIDRQNLRLNASRWRERAVAIELFSGKWRRIVMMANRTSVSRVTQKWQAGWLEGGAFAGGKERHRAAREERENLPRKGRFSSNCEGIR